MRRRDQVAQPPKRRGARGAGKTAAGTRRGEGQPAAREPTSTQRDPKQKTVTVSTARAARWKPLPPATRDFIAAAIDTALLSSLPPNGSDLEASLELLRQLKRRLLDRCSTLLAPPRKPKGLRNCWKLLALEEEQLREGETALRTLQEELDRTLDKLERNRDEAEVLQERICQLRGFLEEAEGAQDVPSGVLNLPRLPAASFQEKTLQEQLMAIENRADILAELRILQRSRDAQDLRSFLELAHSESEPVSHPSH